MPRRSSRELGQLEALLAATLCKQGEDDGAKISTEQNADAICGCTSSWGRARPCQTFCSGLGRRGESSGCSPPKSERAEGLGSPGGTLGDHRYGSGGEGDGGHLRGVRELPTASWGSHLDQKHKPFAFPGVLTWSSAGKRASQLAVSPWAKPRGLKLACHRTAAKGRAGLLLRGCWRQGRGNGTARG